MANINAVDTTIVRVLSLKIKIHVAYSLNLVFFVVTPFFSF